MWTMQQIMENGALGVQITISGKLRGDRSAFEKHSSGILPRAGHFADQVVSEDIAHVETAMGLIGIRIRIALKEKIIPEFEYKNKDHKEDIDTTEKIDDDKNIAPTESEQIKIDAEKISKLDSMEEEEENLK